MVSFSHPSSSLFLPLLALLLLLLPASTIAQRNMTLGSVLTAVTAIGSSSSSWASPSGDFAFGFREIQAGKFLLAIWFDRIPEKTVVWSANRNDLVAEGSTLQFGRDGRLLLSEPNRRQQAEVWSSTVFQGSGTAAYAAMLDNGNFVVVSQQGDNLWQSFDVPTDTLLPGQVLNPDSRLVARFSETNYSTGRFFLRMQTDGNLVFYTIPTNIVNPPYWASKTAGNSSQLVFNQSGDINVVARNGSILAPIVASSSSGSTIQVYQRAILDYDGVFRHYVYPKTNGGDAAARRPSTWSVNSFIPPNICSMADYTGGGACGFNSICSLGNDQRPRCECPPGYSILDGNDHMSGCKPDFSRQECDDGSEDATNFELRDLLNTLWLGSDYEYYNQVSADWCRKACLVDCNCDIAVVLSGNCWMKKGPISNGRIDSNLDATAMVKVRINNFTYRPAGSSDHGSKVGKNSAIILLLSSLLSSSTVISILLLVACIYTISRFRKARRLSSQSPATQGMNLRSFTYQELVEATCNFKEEIGKGACSTVYRGEINNNESVAVKKLHMMVTEGEQEFQAEIKAIGKTNHMNLVQLLGFCNEGEHRILVYEYMRNGSLADYLFGDTMPKWHSRMHIAFGIARGLTYLHEDCNNQIIHCDIKPRNVLLDESFNARISDFGLAKLLKKDETRTVTGIRGTRGYVAPEWFKSMPITSKVDVYSFGILLLELICCRKHFAENANQEQMVLADWACDCYQEKKTYLLVQSDKEANCLSYQMSYHF